VIDLGRSCTRYRPLLVDFVDRGEIAPGLEAALAHLDRCSRCTEAIESTLLTITALRRLAVDAGSVEPSPDAWPRLRVRISRWRRRPAVMSPVAGLAMSVAMVAVLILPFGAGGHGIVDPTVASGATIDLSTSPAERAAENAFIARQRVGQLRRDNAVAPAPSGIHRVNYPDNYRPMRKEVDPAQPTIRSTDAI
jgi:hypothetical protein